MNIETINNTIHPQKELLLSHPLYEKVKTIASQLQLNGFDVKAILSPTVPEGQERLRICIHSYNTSEEISSLMTCIQSLL